MFAFCRRERRQLNCRPTADPMSEILCLKGLGSTPDAFSSEVLGTVAGSSMPAGNVKGIEYRMAR